MKYTTHAMNSMFMLCIIALPLHANVGKDIGKFITSPPQQQAKEIAKIVNKAGKTITYTQDSLIKVTESAIATADSISHLVNTTKKAITDIKVSIAQLKSAQSSHAALGPIFSITKAPLAIHTDALEVLIRSLDTIFTFSKFFIRPFDESAHEKCTYAIVPAIYAHQKIYDVTEKLHRTIGIAESTSYKVNTHSLNMIDLVKKSPLYHKKF